MANLGMNFDPTSVEPDEGRDYRPIPSGTYVLQVVESDVVETKNNDGSILKLTMEVYEGEFKGRKIFENLNIINKSQKAQEIAQSQLSALTKAAGITSTIKDSQDLHYQPFEAVVGIEPESPKQGGGVYPAKNKITRFEFGQTGTPPSTKAAPTPRQATPAAATPASGAKPWQRKVA